MINIGSRLTILFIILLLAAGCSSATTPVQSPTDGPAIDEPDGEGPPASEPEGQNTPESGSDENNLPAKVVLSAPFSGLTNAETTITLSWNASDNTTSYVVYLGGPETLNKIVETSLTEYQLTGLDYNTAYYWRIDSVNQHGSTSSDTWSFNTTTSEDTLRITTLDLGDGSITGMYSANVSATGGTGVGYTWSVVDGVLPDGLTLDDKNGSLSWGVFELVGNVDTADTYLSSGDLTEISGIASSRNNPGVFWALDDSGGGADIFAINEAGDVLQKYSFSGVTNRDWEDMTIGPGPDPDKEYLYIGDIGDNSAVHASSIIMRLEEPTVPEVREAPITLTGVDSFYFVYPGGARDCETMFIDWETQIVYLVSKRVDQAPIRSYKFPSAMSSAWTDLSPVTVAQVGTDDILPATLTAGDGSRDGRRFVLRGYSNIWEYSRGVGDSFDDIFSSTGTAIAVGSAKDQQYEAITYSGDGTAVITTTEKAGASTIPIYKATASEGPFNTTISGAPLNAGAPSFTLQVRDSAGNSSTRSFRLTIN